MESLPHLIQSLLKAYSRCLWTTGGRLCIEKCKWYWMAMRKTKKGKYLMKKNNENPGDIHLIEEMSAGVFGPPLMITIPRIKPTIHQKYFGVPIKPDVSQSKSQLDQLILKSQNHYSKIAPAGMSNKRRWLARCLTLTPALTCAFPLLHFLQSELKKLDQMMGTSIRHSLGLLKTFSTAVIQGPIMFGGLDIASSYAKQDAAKIELFLRRIRPNDDI